MKTKFFTLIMSVGMVFSTLTADVPENGENAITEKSNEVVAKATPGDDNPFTYIYDMKTVEVECQAFEFLLYDDMDGMYYSYVFDSLESGIQLGGIYVDVYYGYQLGCVLSEGDMCTATNCGWDVNYQ